MKVQSVSVHPDGPGQFNTGLHVETRPLSGESTGSVTFRPGSVERGATVFNPRASGEDASNRTRDLLSRVPVGDAKTTPTQDTLFTLPAAFAVKPDGPLHADPRNPGVYRSNDGQSYIKQSGVTYPVRYDGDNATWRVSSPGNPTKYAYPIARDESGIWRQHGAVGLQGGGGRLPARPEISGASRQTIQHRIQLLESELQQARSQEREQTNRLQAFFQRADNLPTSERARQWEDVTANGRDMYLRPIRIEQEIAQWQAELSRRE